MEKRRENSDQVEDLEHLQQDYKRAKKMLKDTLKYFT